MSNQRGQELLAALEELEKELLRAGRKHEPVSLVVLDLDDLEIYSERNGRKVARKALVTTEKLVKRGCRETDVVTRFGSEDFAVVLPDTAKAHAEAVAERIRQLIDQNRFPDEGTQPGGGLTASFGVASYPVDATTPSELVGSADRALYLAKASGKNRVQLYDDSRRSRRRMKVELVGDFSTLETHHHPLKTIDVSTIGVKFATDLELPVGVLIDVRLKLPDSEREIDMAVRIVRTAEIRAPSTGWISGRFQSMGGSYEIAARTLEIGSPDLLRLTRYLRSVDSPA